MPKRTYRSRSDLVPFEGASDLHFRLARSFALITDWMGALTGQFGLDPVLTSLGRQTQAARVALYRYEPGSRRVSGVRSYCRATDTFDATIKGHLARFLVTHHGDALEHGSIWRLSELRRAPEFAVSPAAQEWSQRTDNHEASLIVLETCAEHTDFIELSFESAPRRSPEIPTILVTRALSDAWLLRTPGVMEALMPDPRRDRLADEGDIDPFSAGNPYALTSAERRVFHALSMGQPPKMIAETLGISIATVRSHLRSLYAKTGTTGQRELIAMVQQSAQEHA
ncbi:Bacterial regulatory proteins, luxR family [Roseivivax jejudonensis]|uniref:Bacterial regulatory proteins, luxR family n=1 Tax=Roseivivax jejudonensis TaxID=1529041 RepID=A0A1X6ZD90_9RHOB|nr:helix-turn-helix transcriptional regulator [Roseivivax jejudonensis]SLN46337.1 Bacterial regulatory proteins, luxR family [Roseivivax jejudonensis]